MSTVATSRPGVPAKASTSNFALKIAGSATILAVAITFVVNYVFRYYLHYSQAFFTDPNVGAANYWSMRGWLLMHMTGGMVALLTGPWQFWTGFRMRYATLHRWTGRIFLGGVAIGSIGAFRMGPRLQPDGDRAITVGWASWVLPLLFTQLILQLRRMRSTTS